jgi:hypothetical protein
MARKRKKTREEARLDQLDGLLRYQVGNGEQSTHVSGIDTERNAEDS